MTSLRALLSPGWDSVDPHARAPVALLLHGYGSDENDLPGLAPWLPPGTPWASLRAPLEMAHGGAAWFPLDEPLALTPTASDAAVAAVWQWVDTTAPPGASVITLGFSQGGLIALELLRSRPDRVAATVVLAGFIANCESALDAQLATSRPPVFWGRGDADTVIWPEAIARTEEWLPAHTALTAKVYRGLGHGVGEQEMRDVRTFLAEHVG